MSAHEVTPEAGVDPLASLQATVHSLAHSIATGALHLAVGVVLGRLAAGAMRRWHLHWSWAAGGLGVAVLAHPMLGDLFVPAASATFVAAAIARRRHHEDLAAGADLAELAYARRTPLDGLKALARRLASGLRPAAAVRSSASGEVVVGHDSEGRPVAIPLGGAQGGAHTLIVGATGSGKTVTQTWIAAQAIARGMGAVVVDPKGDPEVRAELRHAAAAAGRRFIEWSPEGPAVYNPYARGSVTEVADRALAGERFTEPHYLRQAQRYLGHAVRAMRLAGEQVSLAALVRSLDPDVLEQLARRMPEPEAAATHAYLDSLTQRQRSDLVGVRDRLAILAESDAGPWLDPAREGQPAFDLAGALAERAVVLFDLQADRRPLLARMLGAAIVQDLQTAIGALQGRPAPCVVAIDEFAAIAAEQVVGLFARARSAGINLLLSTQELSDLRLPGREWLHDGVLGNLTSVIAHRQVVPESARLLAGLAGTKGVWRTSIHSDGRHTRQRLREPLLEPETVQRLSAGVALVIVLEGRNRGARIARMSRCDRARRARQLGNGR